MGLAVAGPDRSVSLPLYNNIYVFIDISPTLSTSPLKKVVMGGADSFLLAWLVKLNTWNAKNHSKFLVKHILANNKNNFM